MPGAVPSNLIDKGFWCIVTGVGQLFHRLCLPYKQLPWLLAKCLNKDADSRELATWFCNLPDCCLNSWFSKPLRALVDQPEDLLPGGKSQPLLLSIYNCKNFNIEVENNFARLRNLKQVSRGREDLSHNLASKHLLSEAKLAHTRHLVRENKAGESLEDSDRHFDLRWFLLRHVISLLCTCSMSRL